MKYQMLKEGTPLQDGDEVQVLVDFKAKQRLGGYEWRRVNTNFETHASPYRFYRRVNVEASGRAAQGSFAEPDCCQEDSSCRG